MLVRPTGWRKSPRHGERVLPAKRSAYMQPFFLCFPRKAGEMWRQYNARMKLNAQYQEMYWARNNLIHRFVKWGQIHELVSGSFDDVERPELLELLRIRTASYSGSFAKHFLKDKPTPKQYFALRHAVEFLAENDFSGEGDEQPMETLLVLRPLLFPSSLGSVARGSTMNGTAFGLSCVTVSSRKWLWNIA